MDKGWHACHYCDGYILLEDTYYYEFDDDNDIHPICWDCLMDSRSKILEKHWGDDYCCEENVTFRMLNPA